MNLGSLLSGAGALFGTLESDKAAKRYYGSQAALTDQIARQYGTYMPRLNEILLGIVRQGGRTAADDAATRQAETDTGAYYRTALAKLLQANEAAGLGNSLSAQHAQLALARANAGTLARQRTDRLATQQGRVWDALQLLAGNVRGSGDSALSSYNRLGAAAGASGDAAAQWGKVLATLAQVLGAG